tara:strand:+ start:52 stop:1467 length:1416 start_codon:yes stop_codon:yes gene_type:complete
MKVTIENKKGLNKDLKVFVDKKTIENQVNEKYDEISKTVQLKGFRPGKVPKEVIKRQFGKAVFGEVLDKVLKETSTKVLTENKIKPAGQPKIDLKKFGEDKDLEYVISVTELPKINLKSIENIKVDQYEVSIDNKEVDKRINDIAKNQKNFVEVDPAKVANEGDLVVFDYKATVDGKDFKGNEGKNTQLELGKDLFIKGFDKQLLKVKKDETVNVEVNLPENFPEKDLIGKTAKFICKINSVKKSQEVKINDDFAKNLGAKDLKDLKTLLEKQINEEYKNSLKLITKQQILDQIGSIKMIDIPENLVEQEVKILSQGLNEEQLKNKKNGFEKKAKERIKVGLILNEFGEENKIKVEENEIQTEFKKQLRMMPGQEKFLMEYYQKNPSAIASLRGTIYEDKIIDTIISKSKVSKKKIDKKEADKILKEQNEKEMKKSLEDFEIKKDTKTKKTNISAKSASSKKKISKKVSKK